MIIHPYIKKGILLTFSAFTALHTSAQLKPDGSSIPAATAAPLPAGYNSPQINYIRIYEPSMPAADPAAVSAATDVKAVKQTTQYFDGLGRLIQTVNKGASGGSTSRDLVTPVVYDSLGRERYKYLPYVSSAADGKFKQQPFTELNTFAGNQYPGEKIFYSETVFEASPLNRVLKTMAPGNSWTGAGRGVSSDYQINTTADAVVIWSVPANGIIPVKSGVYAAGQLFKNITTDETGNRVVEFKDKEGQVVLKKVELLSGSADGHNGWLCTYYVYDDLNLLRFVIPPKAVELMKTTWVVSQQIADELCFQYQYDGRRRMITKSVPGTRYATEMVYDLRDRLVFTRDANLRTQQQPQWLATFYDNLNRPVMTALYNSSATRDALQTSMNGSTGTQQVAYTFPGTADLYLNQHDGSPEYKATNSVNMEDGFDTGASGTTDVFTAPAANAGSTTIAATNALPGITPSQLTPLTYTFYDKYNYTGALPAVTADFTKLQAGNNPYAEPVSAVSSATTGLVTGNKVRVLNTDIWLTTSIYYDDKGRTIQLVSDKMNTGKDVVSTLYDFNGKALSTYQYINNSKSKVAAVTSLLTVTDYDAMGRVTGIRKSLNGTLLKDMVQNSYDDLGQLKTKTLSNIESLDYDYNIRGWLKGINKEFAKTGGQGHFFGTELHYDYGYTQSQFNGNISGITWRSKSDQQWRSYGYRYDAANRLLKADFTQNNSGWNTSAGYDFTVTMGDGATATSAYDANGNILAMTQKGRKGTSSADIDRLAYTYLPNSNKLQGVIDNANDPSSTLGDFKEINGQGSNDYNYDDNGNLTQDENKSIKTGGISYNHLNLPRQVAIRGKGTIVYQYDAAGNKLRKTVTDSTSSTPKVTVTDYISGLVYQNDTLQFIPHEEGRIRAFAKANQPVAYFYDYFVKDHLGNVRMVLTDQQDTSIYRASMETAAAPVENALFSNVDNTRFNKPVGYPADQSSEPNEFVAKLNAKSGGQRIGPSLVLRVMAGDTVSINTQAFYKSTSPQQNNKSPLAEDMVADLARAFSSPGTDNSAHGIADATGTTPFNTNFYNNDYRKLQEKNQDQPQADKPKAYLNFVLFDDQFKLVEENSGVKQVKATPDELQQLGTEKMTVSKSGFLYVYTSNETPQDVFFDNLVVVQNAGRMLEETHYYPFGLTMAGISSNALKGSNYAENKMKYNGKGLQNKEFGDGSGLEWYDYGARMYDAQIGRWHAPDPMADKWNAYSPYNYTINNPINVIDPDGKDAIYSYDEKTKTITVTAKIFYQGGGLPKSAEEREKLMSEMNAGLKEVFKDGTTTIDNVEYSVKFNVTAEINEGLTEKDLKEGENIMNLSAGNEKLADGTDRANVGGSKMNMGYVSGKDGVNANVHEIGHMIGLKDRYTDYENSKNPKMWRSIIHSEYKKDLMGSAIKSLNQSHYDNIVKYTLFKLIQGQKNLLPEYRSSSVRVIQNVDANSESSPSPTDIPEGWQPRGIKK
ncbi:RHS repeat-associated core domain-containing protein [Chitinophaga sp. Mgbs1]|uniref:RHS repeat-associated core domain-containing protein n=1 Tax=Chitinophaga solisilvae TaxID=1233460 RepID=A0A3S1AXP1_9BACT|nr:RHS repeat-associated core domain-containing protein [Chitinophaga solisilvae]